MMSSCWTFLLKRRRAFSRGSPSWILTSAKLKHPTLDPDWTPKFLSLRRLGQANPAHPPRCHPERGRRADEGQSLGSLIRLDQRESAVALLYSRATLPDATEC